MGAVEFSKPLTARNINEYHKEHLVRSEQVGLDQGLIAILGYEPAPGEMVAATKAQSAGGMLGYYKHNSYLLGWHGKLADHWELVGKPVEDLHFRRMSDGQDPHTGEQLVRKRGLVDPWSDTAWRSRLTSTCKNAGPEALRDLRPSDRRPRRKAAEPRNLPTGDWDEIGELIKAGPDKIERLKRMHAIAAEHFQAKLLDENAGKAVRNYLDGRKVSERVRDHFQLGASNSGNELTAMLRKEFADDEIVESGLSARYNGKLYDRFKNRLMIPIKNTDGEIVAFAGRQLHESESGRGKYENNSNSAIYQKRKTLYNYSEARAEQTGRTVLVEGYFDVWAAWESGVKDVAAACGTAVSDEQIQMLSVAGSDVLMNFNGGPEEFSKGQQKTEDHISNLLKAGLRVRVLNLEGDPFEFVSKNGPALYAAKIKNAGPLVEWLGDRAKDKFKTGNSYDQAKALAWIREHFNGAAVGLRPEIAKELEWYLKARPDKVGIDIAARDLVFSLPKGYSVAALVGGDTRIIEIAERAMFKALDAGQEYSRARMGGNLMPENSANWAAAIFRHVTARPSEGHPPNPHLHWHTVIFNMVQTADGTIRAMEPEELFRVQAYMNAIFQKEIDAGVRTIGYFTRSHERGLATEIEGYSDEFLAAMSRRAAEITAEKKARGVEGAEADEIINKALRRGKEDWDPELLRGKWLEEAASLGQDPIGLKTTADQTTPECWSQERRKSYAAAAVEYAFDSLMEHQAVVDRYEVMERALQFALCSPLVFEDIEGALDHRQQIAQPGHGSILAVDHYREGRPGERYTTSAMKSAENEIVQIALGGKGRALPVTDLRRDQWNEFKAQYREREVNGKKIQLNDSQLLAIFLVVRSSDQTMILRGAAGVGKSTLLESVSEISEQISKAGYQLRGTSPTTSATGNLVEIGLQAETLAARNLREIKPTEPAQFVVLDEGSLADTLAVLALMRSLRPDKDRLLIAYDPRQHAAVGAGRPVEQMEAQGVQTITLEKIVRQNENPELLRVMELLRDSFEPKKTKVVLDALAILDRELGGIEADPDKRNRVKILAEFFAADPRNRILVAPDNATLLQLGVACRESLPESELQRSRESQHAILTGVKAIRNADRRRASRYEPGDVIRWAKNSNLAGRGSVERGEYSEVLAIDAKWNRLTISTKKGPVTFSASAAQGEVYRNAHRTFAPGERIRLTRSWNTEEGDKIANGAIGRMLDINEKGEGVLEFGKKRYKWSVSAMPHLDYGYATTSYRGQSLTYDGVGVHLDCGNTQLRGLTDKVLAYVGFSRAAKELLVVTDSKEELMGDNSPLLRHYVKPTANPMPEKRERTKQYQSTHPQQKAAQKKTASNEVKIHGGILRNDNTTHTSQRLGY